MTLTFDIETPRPLNKLYTKALFILNMSQIGLRGENIWSELGYFIEV